jgi:tRNA (guanine26-N2/guanine27-N2)-dimethyltransferase
MIKIKENSAWIYADKKHKKKISKELEVFYNPVMKTNRDLTILFLKAAQNLDLIKKDILVGLPLSGSGIRGIRFLNELSFVKKIYFNDLSKKAVKNIKKNLKLNKVKKSNYIIYNEDANLFLDKSKGFDYVDIDPFGSPNQFLDSALRRLSRGGFLAVTATDTAALTGTFPSTTLWKYWAQTYLTPEKHELGLRILIRKIQLIASQYERALIPVFSYVKDHYYRIIFHCIKSKTQASKLIKQHKVYLPRLSNEEIGPLWFGKLNNLNILKEMIKICKDEKELKFLNLLKTESKLNFIGFVDMHQFFKKTKLKQICHEEIINLLKSKNFDAARTHFSYKGIKTNASFENLKNIIK